MQLLPAFTESGGHLSVPAPAGTAAATPTAVQPMTMYLRTPFMVLSAFPRLVRLPGVCDCTSSAPRESADHKRIGRTCQQCPAIFTRRPALAEQPIQAHSATFRVAVRYQGRGRRSPRSRMDLQRTRGPSPAVAPTDRDRCER